MTSRFHWGLSHVMRYMKHSFQCNNLMRDFLVIQSRQLLAIGTNWMWDVDNNTPSTPRVFAKGELQQVYADPSVDLERMSSVQDVLSVCCFSDEFLKMYSSEFHSFQSTYQSRHMKGFERCFWVEDQGTWHQQKLRAEIFRGLLWRGYKLNFLNAIWQKKNPSGD